jgi:hypothetical protein
MRAEWVADQEMGDDDRGQSLEQARATKLAVPQALAGVAPPEPRQSRPWKRKAEGLPVDTATAGERV